MWRNRNETVAIAVLILVTLVALALMLTFPVDAQAGEPGGLTEDQLYAAQVAAGEAPASLMGEGAYTFLLCTIENRVNSPRFPDTFRGVVEHGFYAPPRTLTWMEHQIAALYWTDTSGLYDCVGVEDVFYVISEQDRQRLGFPEGDFWFGRELPSGYLLALHFYRDWPRPERDEKP